MPDVRRFSFFLGIFGMLTLVGFAATMEAANLFAVLIADSEDASIGKGVYNDLSRVNTAVKIIARHTNLDLKQALLKGLHSTTGELFQAIAEWEVEPDDVVIFYFSGHGYRTSHYHKCPWPILEFTLEDKGVELDVIQKKLAALHPCLLLVIADACNNLIPDLWAPLLVSKGKGKSTPEKEVFREAKGWQEGESCPEEGECRENVRRLFLERKGTVIATSSRAGELSWNTSQGSLFTAAFLKSLAAETVSRKKKPSWKKLMKRVGKEILKDQLLLSQPNQDMQHPYYYLKIKKKRLQNRLFSYK